MGTLKTVFTGGCDKLQNVEDWSAVLIFSNDELIGAGFVFEKFVLHAHFHAAQTTIQN